MPEFFAPAPLAAVALMALNDHVLKARFHNDATGKLSDVAVCFFLPLLVSGVLGLVMPARRGWRLAIGAATTAVVFVAIELSDGFGAAYVHVTKILGAPLGIRGGGALTRDMTDLFALGAIPVACFLAARAMGRRAGRHAAGNPGGAR